MRVSFMCGYYSDLAHRTRARRTEPYWDAYFFTWGVKVGSFKREFTLKDRGVDVRITASNFALVRKSFGSFVASVIEDLYSGADALLVPVPSKDRLAGVSKARSTLMVQESMRGTPHQGSIESAVRWGKSVEKAHEGGPRGREELRKYLEVDKKIKGKSVILIDDLLSTGGNMLATMDALQDADVNVLGAITCGKTVYDTSVKPFSRQEFELTEELSDFA